MEFNPKFKEGDIVYEPSYSTVLKYTIKELLGIEYVARRKEQPVLITYSVINKYDKEVVKLEHELCATYEEALNIVADKYVRVVPEEIKEAVITKLKQL